MKYQWQVVVAYNGPYGDKGRVISRHQTYAAAEKVAKKRGGWVAVKETN